MNPRLITNESLHNFSSMVGRAFVNSWLFSLGKINNNCLPMNFRTHDITRIIIKKNYSQYNRYWELIRDNICKICASRGFSGNFTTTNCAKFWGIAKIYSQIYGNLYISLQFWIL